MDNKEQFQNKIALLKFFQQSNSQLVTKFWLFVNKMFVTELQLENDLELQRPLKLFNQLNYIEQKLLIRHIPRILAALFNYDINETLSRE
jgi:hypothetical protein